MLFRKKNAKEERSDHWDYDALALESLSHLCVQGMVIEDAFVIEDKDIYVYVDVIEKANNVAQIIFQLHHEWLEEPILESVAASGNDMAEAIALACENFLQNVLQLYIQAVEHKKAVDRVIGFTQLRHYFQVYCSPVNGLGKREGFMDKDFWEMLKEEVIKRLGNKKIYWVKVFTSKNKAKVLCEVRINGVEDSELSERLLPYAENWDCISAYHTEKQCFLIVQEEQTYEPADFTKEEIVRYTNKAIRLFEKCKDKDAYRKLKDQLISACKDDSLAYEIVAFLPELYCQYAYPEVEVGNRLFLVQKGKETRELYQSQVRSFSYIEETLRTHMKEQDVSMDTIQQVLQFSANARAIQQALAQGDRKEELYLPGIGYYARNDYILR